jgi:hypothetical protein
VLGRAPPEASKREELQAIDSHLRSERLKAMRRTGTGVSAGDVISDEVKASLAKLAERRSASAPRPRIRGDRGKDDADALRAALFDSLTLAQTPQGTTNAADCTAAAGPGCAGLAPREGARQDPYQLSY